MRAAGCPAFFFHNPNTIGRSIRYKTGHHMNPDGVLIDFEVTLSNAWSRVFPSCVPPALLSIEALP
jgi:hypothetical protein